LGNSFGLKQIKVCFLIRKSAKNMGKNAADIIKMENLCKKKKLLKFIKIFKNLLKVAVKKFNFRMEIR
jgi:hypothetical protein